MFTSVPRVDYGPISFLQTQEQINEHKGSCRKTDFTEFQFHKEKR